MEPKKYNELVNITKRSKLTDIENKLVATTGEEKWGGQYTGRGVRGTSY